MGFGFFQHLQYYIHNVSHSRVSKYLWENGNISFTELTSWDLQQTIIFWTSLSCSSFDLSSLSNIFMPLSITASIMATCHWVIQCKLEFDSTEHADDRTHLRKYGFYTVWNIFYAFVQSEREILNRINSEETCIYP